MHESLSLIPSEKRASFIVGNVLRVCVDEDRQAAAGALRARLRGYLLQPQYPRYWSEAGYEAEMQAASTLAAEGKLE